MGSKGIDADRFACTIGERAAFEAGIKLGSLFHQFIGTPVGPDNRISLQRAMEDAVRTQPHVSETRVDIDEDAMLRSLSDLDYCPLNERMIKAMVVIKVKDRKCRARLEWIEDMEYPLMWIESME